jgi:hypothetical protein
MYRLHHVKVFPGLVLDVDQETIIWQRPEVFSSGHYDSLEPDPRCPRSMALEEYAE